MAKTTLDRLKFELNNRDYFEDIDYANILDENGLDSTINYDKSTMQKQLLYTVIDILEAVSNDLDTMKKIEVEFETTEGAAKHLKTRIQDIRTRIASIPDPIDPEANSMFSLMFRR
ncbi:MAG: hypothetical protein ACYDG2_22955 [Ruminiclostridium sp.]